LQNADNAGLIDISFIKTGRKLMNATLSTKHCMISFGIQYKENTA
jgi:hypothetical protein